MRSQSSSLPPPLRPALSDAAAVPTATAASAAATPSSPQQLQSQRPPQHAGVASHVKSVGAQLCPNAQVPTASSSSNGDTHAHTSDRRGGGVSLELSDTCDGAHSAALRTSLLLRPPMRGKGDSTTTSVELSAVPEPAVWETHGRVEEMADVTSPAPSSVRCGDGDGADTTWLETSPLRDVWTRHVYIHPTAAASGRRESATLSDAASLMIAQAVHRASLLQRCFVRWLEQQARHEQRRRHDEYFAEGYYLRNLVYLFFRAWQWRQARRLTSAAQRSKLTALVARRRQRGVFGAWRQWSRRRDAARQRLSALHAEVDNGLVRSYFGKWRGASTQRALARAASLVSADVLRERRFCDWRRLAWRRCRERIVVGALQLHTPAAWASSATTVLAPSLASTAPQLLSCEELLRRHTWIQWLRVALQRRACRLRRYEAAVATLATRTAQVPRRESYVRWLQATFAALQLKQSRRELLRRYYSCWAAVGVAAHRALQWRDGVHSSRVLRLCFTSWRAHLDRRQTNKERRRMAERFFSSVVQTHAARAAFRCWQSRQTIRARARRMHRVAEEYARPALLRYLFARRVTDAVLASPMGLADALEHADVHRSRVSAPDLLRPANAAGGDSSPAGPPRHSPHRRRLPIPLRQHQQHHEPRLAAPPTTAAETLRAAPAPTLAVAGIGQHALVEREEVPSPPPPSYEEATGGTGGTAVALQARRDAGVGPGSDAAVPCATPRSTAGGRRSTACQHESSGEEAAITPLVCAASRTSVCSAAAAAQLQPTSLSWYPALFGAPLCWANAPTPAAVSMWPLPVHGPLMSMPVTPPVSTIAVGPCASSTRVLSDAATLDGELRGVAARAVSEERVPSASPAPSSPAAARLSQAVPPAPPSPRTHYGFDIHRHVDPVGPLSHVCAAPAHVREDPGCVDSPGAPASEGQQHRWAGGRGARVAQGRVPLRLAGVCAQQAAHTAASSSPLPASASAPPRVSEPLLEPPSHAAGSAALRAQARSTLDDYRCRTRLVAAERVELEAVEAQLALCADTSAAGAEDLARRRRYLQQRVLEWEQRRAQVAQLAVRLQSRVSAAASTAVSQDGAMGVP
ncbi:hypothetical protein NESM_000256600 [Novymonas esmeraldas]|uniref:Sfi1 spindle body domain-containing protein n=1 Tax=Novymonas esmeraldas TaxID=1808958 RepID=A0AAW0F8I7_9TRYP